MTRKWMIAIIIATMVFGLIGVGASQNDGDDNFNNESRND